MRYLELLNEGNDDFGINPETGEKGFLTDEEANNSKEQLQLVEDYASQVKVIYDNINKDILQINKKTQEDLSQNLDEYTNEFRTKAESIRDLIEEISNESGSFIDPKKVSAALDKVKNITKKTK